jgi:hypothetical protein
MIRFDQATLADVLLNAPGWARVGIAAPAEGLRIDAANELARFIVKSVGECKGDEADPNQLALAL